MHLLFGRESRGHMAAAVTVRIRSSAYSGQLPLWLVGLIMTQATPALARASPAAIAMMAR
jgi:hypothetical protein